MPSLAMVSLPDRFDNVNEDGTVNAPFRVSFVSTDGDGYLADVAFDVFSLDPSSTVAQFRASLKAAVMAYAAKIPGLATLTSNDVWMPQIARGN